MRTIYFCKLNKGFVKFTGSYPDQQTPEEHQREQQLNCAKNNNERLVLL